MQLSILSTIQKTQCLKNSKKRALKIACAQNSVRSKWRALEMACAQNAAKIQISQVRLFLGNFQ